MEYLYSARVLAVHDGDTFRADVDLAQKVRRRDRDLGFHTHVQSGGLHLHATFRLDGLNANELADPGGAAARDYLLALMPVGSAVTLDVLSIDGAREKYGRGLARVILADGRCANDLLIASGHARSWTGRGIRPTTSGRTTP